MSPSPPPLREGRQGPGVEFGGRGASLSGGEGFGPGNYFPASEVSNAIAEYAEQALAEPSARHR